MVTDACLLPALWLSLCLRCACLCGVYAHARGIPCMYAWVCARIYVVCMCVYVYVCVWGGRGRCTCLYICVFFCATAMRFCVYWPQGFHNDDHSGLRRCEIIFDQLWLFQLFLLVDISATTQAERVWAIFGMLIGGFVFAGVIGSIAKTVDDHNLSRKAFNEKMDMVASFVGDSRLPSELRNRVLRYFRRQEVHAYNESEILGELPFVERMDFLWYSYGELIMMVPIFREANRMFLGEVMNALEPLNLQPGCMVTFRRGDATHMFVVAKGSVEIILDDGETVYRLIRAGAYFGEEACFGDNDDSDDYDKSLYFHNVRVGGNVNTKLLRLSREAMVEMFERYPAMRKIMIEEHGQKKDVLETARKQAKLKAQIR